MIFYSSDSVQLSSPCNQACNCSGVSYTPVCGVPLTYFSPCHAGCSQVNTSKKVGCFKIISLYNMFSLLTFFLFFITFLIFLQGLFSYANCACVARTGETSGKVKKGNCFADCGLNFVLFLIILGLIPFLTFSGFTPAYIVTLR